MQRHIPANDTRSNTKADATENNSRLWSFLHLRQSSRYRRYRRLRRPNVQRNAVPKIAPERRQSDGAYFFSSPVRYR